jgi:non-ribosomal peptide synthetase-like protein
VVVMNALNYADDYYWYLLVSPVIALAFVVLLCLEIAALKWLLLGRVKPGRYATHSLFYVRKWFVDQLLELSLDVLGPLYASIYLAPWYRLLGARLGARAEISTASFISPDLLEVGDESFIADSVSLGAARLEKGHVTIGVNRIGKRSFIGNSALLPPGVVVGNNALIGCLSTPPANPVDAARDGATWLGSPPMFLPQRQPSTAFSLESTFRPTPKLQAQRAAIEFVRVILPVTGFVVLSSLLFSTVVWLEPKR